MSQFELAITLLSFVYALALTHVLQCLRDLWVERDRVKFAWSQVLWMIVALQSLLMGWFPAANTSGMPLTGLLFLHRLATGVTLYFSCAFVSPAMPEEGELDLKAYEDRNGAAYKLAMIVALVLSVYENYGFATRQGAQTMAVGAFLVTQWPLMIIVAIVLASIWRRETWVRTPCAAALVVGSGFFMLANFGVLPLPFPAAGG